MLCHVIRDLYNIHESDNRIIFYVKQLRVWHPRRRFHVSRHILTTVASLCSVQENIVGTSRKKSNNKKGGYGEKVSSSRSRSQNLQEHGSIVILLWHLRRSNTVRLDDDDYDRRG